MTNHQLMQYVYDKYFAGLGVTVPHFRNVSGKTTIYIAQGLTCDIIYDAWTFRKRKSVKGSIDAALDQSREARKATNGSYLVRVANGAEPDQKFLGKSTYAVDQDGTIGITLLERMLFELMHPRKHLDVLGSTLCSGSRYSSDFIPSVYLDYENYVNVDGCGLDHSYKTCGIRKAVLKSL